MKLGEFFQENFLFYNNNYSFETFIINFIELWSALFRFLLLEDEA